MPEVNQLMSKSVKAVNQRIVLIRLFVLLLSLLGSLQFSSSARALPKDSDDGPAFICDQETIVSATLKQESFSITGLELLVTANNANVIAIEPDPVTDCAITVYPLPQFQWQLVTQPSGGSASLSGGSTLAVSLTPNVPGEYMIRFTGCPNGCSIVLADGSTASVAARSFDLSFDVVDELAIPPATEVILPSLDASLPTPVEDIDEICGFGSDFISAAWVTIEPWLGTGDYETLEGLVLESRLSTKDNNLNHDSLDFLTFVEPDAPFYFLRTPIQDDLEVEWEYLTYPEIFRPTRSDRISTTGYWIIDCPHGDKTEIHPPVLQAAHRPRAIHIPESEGFGTNVYVPGIVTEIWISQDAGETTRNCSTTGLHQRPGFGGLDDCLPQSTNSPSSPGYDASPIDAIFEFNIYLPPNPQDIVASIKDVPPVPLYHRSFGRPGTDFGLSASDPVISVCPAECPGEPTDATFLKVRIDLRTFSGSSYSRRIEAGWVYPAPDNWGLRRWKIRLNSIDVRDDGDGVPFNDGDWRLWFNTNNTDQEWTKIIDCNGCIEEGNEDFSGSPWETGSGDPNRFLGSDLLLYPGQEIWVHTTGFDDDWIWEDSIGRITDLLPQVQQEYSSSSNYCKPTGESDCLRNTLHYEILEGDPVGEVELSSAGQEIYSAYLITRADLSDEPPFVVATTRDWNHPLQEASSETPRRLNGRDYFKEQGVEINALHDISLERFIELTDQAREQRPELLDATMQEIRQEIDQGYIVSEQADMIHGLRVLREALPADLWDKYLGDVTLPNETDGNTGTPVTGNLMTIILFVLLIAVIVL